MKEVSDGSGCDSRVITSRRFTANFVEPSAVRLIDEYPDRPGRTMSKAFAFRGRRLGFFVAAAPRLWTRSSWSSAVPPVGAHPGRGTRGSVACRTRHWVSGACGRTRDRGRAARRPKVSGHPQRREFRSALARLMPQQRGEATR